MKNGNLFAIIILLIVIILVGTAVIFAGDPYQDRSRDTIHQSGSLP